MDELHKNKKDIEYGIEEIIERYSFVKDKLNHSSAYTDEETVERLKLTRERNTLIWVLGVMGIQDFELKDKYVNVNID
jgi:hypothetical protein